MGRTPLVLKKLLLSTFPVLFAFQALAELLRDGNHLLDAHETKEPDKRVIGVAVNDSTRSSNIRDT